jgi:nicotinamide mononucleotide adenylyltransferase
MHSSTALFMGRFQPPSIAHWCTVETILQSWVRVVIVIVYNVAPPNTRPEYKDLWQVFSSASYTPGKNPFTAEEVRDMWESCINAHDLSDCVSCRVIPRPEFNPGEFNTMFPPGEFELVRTERFANDAEIDVVRGAMFPELFRRPIGYVRPPFKLHNSEIRTRVSNGQGSWSDFIAPGAFETFQRLDGPARMRAAEADLLAK